MHLVKVSSENALFLLLSHDIPVHSVEEGLLGKLEHIGSRKILLVLVPWKLIFLLKSGYGRGGVVRRHFAGDLVAVSARCRGKTDFFAVL